MEYYDSLWNLRDKRMDNWPLMHSITPTLILSASYMIFCTTIGPWLMKDRKPYELKGIIQLYNISQVAISAYIVYVIGAYGWFSHYDWMCQPVEMDPDPSSFAMKIGTLLEIIFQKRYLMLMIMWSGSF